MNDFLSNQLFHYPIILILLLSVCISLGVVVLGTNLLKFWSATINFIESDLPEILSLLIYPSTYQDGLSMLSKAKPYKYFLPLIHELVGKQRVSGVSLKLSFEQLRYAIHKDLQFENKLRIFIKESCLQYFAYVIFSWLLCILFAWNKFALPLSYYVLIAFMHLCGFLFLFIYIHHCQKKMKYFFDSFVPKLYRVMISFDSKLNYVEESNLDKLNYPPIILRYSNILGKLVSKRNTYGVSIGDELKLLAKDFWYGWEGLWEKSKVSIERIKFSLIMLIFGGAFMLILFGISQVLVTGMFV